VGEISREKHESYEMHIHYPDHGNRDPQQGGDSASQEQSDFRLLLRRSLIKQCLLDCDILRAIIPQFMSFPITRIRQQPAASNREQHRHH